ncbi:SxtJ family membrane protein [Pelagibacteraceae bacterium]|nr:SxtJ family membrane protein [Pelagibacteraceae bacterium]
MKEIKKYHNIEIGSEKNFGFIFSAIFLIVAFYPWLLDKDMRLWSIIISGLLIILSIFFPKTLILPNKLWFKFGIILGNIVSPIVMGIIFFLTVTPIGLIMKMLNKDILEEKMNKEKSYWKNKNSLNSSMKNQF